ncbi:MAG: hypothetical protein IJW33_01265 [Lentisphaeria bacterium]|nr:hypothetical protein [Lentisphaeria bacterium]
MMKNLTAACFLLGLLLTGAKSMGDGFGKEALSPDYIEPSGRFERVMADGQSLRMGFKKVEFAPGAVIKSIVVNREEILAAPVTVELRVNGNVIKPVPGKLSVKNSGKNAVEAVSCGTFPGGSLELAVSAAWDHTLQAKLTVKADKPLEIESLAMIFPMRFTGEKLLNGCSEPPAKRIAGQQAAKLWVRKNITAKEVMNLSMWHNLWLGTTRYGLAWSFADLKNWNTTPGKEMIFDSQKDRLTISLIDRKTPVKNELTYSWVMNITPIAKMPANWRSWKIGTRYNNTNKLAANKLIYWSFWRPGTIATHNSNWVFDEKKLKEISAFDAAAGKARMFYFIPSHYTWSALAVKEGKEYMLVDTELKEMTARAFTTPDYSYKFREPAKAEVITSLEEWKKLFDGKVPVTKRAGERTCRLSRELLERNLNIVHKFANEYDIPGIYSDGVAPKADFTIANGAVKDSAGNIRPVYALSEYQELFRRIRAAVTAKDPENAMMAAHNSAIRFMPALALFDFVIFGEDFFYWYQDPEKRNASPDGEFYYAHIWGNIDNLKTEFYRQYGQVQVFLPELRGANRKVFPELTRGTRTMLCYTIQFDMLYWALWCDAREVNTFDAIRQQFGVAGSETAQVEFIPYWENKKFIPSVSGVKIGYYEKNFAHDPYAPEPEAQSFLLMVSNPEFNQNEFSFSIPEEFKNLTVTNCYTRKVLPVTDGKVTLSLAPFDFTVIEVAVQE